MSLIALSWLDEFAGLPRLLFGSGSSHNWHEALLESLALLAVWFVVIVLTRSLAQPACSVQVCMWCRKISDGRKWVPAEDYFGCQPAGEPPQCMCPTCRQRWNNYGAPQGA